MTHSRHMRKVLILGAGGKVGRLLARAWRHCPPAGIEPVFQSRVAEGAGGLRWQEGDALADLPRVAAVVALWGVTPGAPRVCSENTRLALLAGEIARTLGAERLFLASSAAVYGPVQDGRLTEDIPLPVPPGSYGKSKLDMEHAMKNWAARPGPRPRISALRLANVVGADSLFAALKSGGPVTLDRFADGGGPARSYLTAGDLGRILQALVTCPPATLPPVLNVAGRRALAMADLVRTAGAEVVWRPAPATATQRVELDTTLLRRFLGADLDQSSAPGPAIAALQALETLP